MANTKRIEKRLEKVEEWAKAFEKETGPRQTMENMNWLVGQTRALGERLQNESNGVQELQQALTSNSQVLNQFLEQHDMVRDWQMFLEGLQAEAQQEDENNAVQESGSEEMDAQDQTEDGEGMGEGASEGDQDTEESQEEANKEE